MAVQWNGSFEATPAGGESPALGDDRFRELKGAIRERIEKEHVMTTGTGSYTNHGWHKAGAACAYFTQGTPTYLPDGSTSLSGHANAKGRLWINSSTMATRVYDGSAWRHIMREITRVSVQGTLATGTSLTPHIIFPRTATIVGVIMRSKTAPTTSSVVINLKKNGTTSIFKSGALLSIPAGSYWGQRTQLQLTSLALTPSSYLQFDITAAGGTTKGSDLALVIEALI